jgi:hypothetical protein
MVTPVVPSSQQARTAKKAACKSQLGRHWDLRFVCVRTPTSTVMFRGVMLSEEDYGLKSLLTSIELAIPSSWARLVIAVHVVFPIALALKRRFFMPGIRAVEWSLAVVSCGR